MGARAALLAILRAVAVPLLYLAAAALVFHNAWASPESAVIGPPALGAPRLGAGIQAGDSRAALWFLNWTPFALGHGQSLLSSDWLAYPKGVNLMWNPTMPVAGLLTWPLQALFGITVAYDATLTAALALGAWLAHLLCRRYTASRLAAFAGGLLFGFSPYMLAQSQAHANLVAGAALTPLLALCIDELLVRRRLRAWVAGAWLGAAAALVFYTSVENLLIDVVVAAVAVYVLAATQRGHAAAVARHGLTGLSVAAAVGGLLALPGLVTLLWGPQHVTGTVRTPGTYVVDLLNLVTPTDVQQMAPRAALDVAARFTGNSSEWDGYLGVPLLVLLLAVVWVHRRTAVVRVAAVMAAVAVVLSLGDHLHVGGTVTSIPLPWAALQRLPFLNGILPARIASVTALFCGLLLAVGLDAWLRDRRSPRSLAALGLAALALLSLLPWRGYAATAVSTPRFFRGAAVAHIAAGDVVLVAPWAEPAAPESMVWQVDTGMRFRMPSGYANIPGPNGEIVDTPQDGTAGFFMREVRSGSHPALDDATAAAMRADLRRWHVTAVVVGPMPNREEMEGDFTTLLGRPPQRDGGVSVWWDVAASP